MSLVTCVTCIVVAWCNSSCFAQQLSLGQTQCLGRNQMSLGPSSPGPAANSSELLWIDTRSCPDGVSYNRAGEGERRSYIRAFETLTRLEG